MSGFSTPINSTIVRSSFSLSALVRTYFAVVSRLLPDVAKRQAEHLFTAPPPYAGRGSESLDAREERVLSGKHSLALWHAGPSNAPAVLLVHGWGGRGIQMGSFVAPLLASGCRVVWFDHPGHGASGRGPSSLPDFVRAVQTIAGTHGPFAAAVGHSLGAAALGIAMRGGLQLRRVAFVSPPASITEHVHKFARILGITPSIREAMRHVVERRYGMRFADIDSIDELTRLHLAALFVHDNDDTEVPLDNALRLSARMPNARLIKTYGLGHNRILRDRAVIRAIVDFIRGDADQLPAELPVLPRPAPLY
jgi:pimeloyl-ACP methyl ester carboxylesterase